MKPASLLSFLIRYARLIILAIVFAILNHVDRVTYYVGPLFFLLELAVWVYLAALVLRHLGFRRTLDAYVTEPPTGDSQFVREWQEASPALRLILSVAFIIGMVGSFSLIAAAIAK